MTAALIHPVQFQKDVMAKNAKTFALRHKTMTESQMAGFFDDLFDSAWDAISGVAEAVGSALTSVVNTIKQIGETIALIVRAVMGDVDWSEVFSSLGEIFQEIGNIMAVLNPARLVYNWLSEAPLTKHAFAELDKFTGGFITNVVNVSDLPWRAMRGDPISKREILLTIVTIIQVVGLVIGGPVAIAMFVGSMVGREVCKHQTQAKDLCKASFQIVAAAFGQWTVAAEEVTFQTLLQEASVDYLRQRGIDEISVQAIRVCQEQNWVGDQECKIIGQVAANYIKNVTADEEDQLPWEEFLANEVARLGVEQLMLQWFPPESKEARAIKWRIQYHDVIVPYEVPGGIPNRNVSPGALLALAAGGMMLLIGAGS